MTEPYFRRYHETDFGDREVFDQFLKDREEDNLGMRLGQHFINAWCPELQWPSLFYEERDVVAITVILDFLDAYRRCSTASLKTQAQTDVRFKHLERDHRELKKEVAALRKIIVEAMLKNYPSEPVHPRVEVGGVSHKVEVKIQKDQDNG